MITMVGHGIMEADTVLEMRVLHPDQQVTGSELKHWVWLEHI